MVLRWLRDIRSLGERDSGCFRVRREKEFSVENGADGDVAKFCRSAAVVDFTVGKHCEMVELPFMEMSIHVEPQASSSIDMIDEDQLSPIRLRFLDRGEFSRHGTKRILVSRQGRDNQRNAKGQGDANHPRSRVRLLSPKSSDSTPIF